MLKTLSYSYNFCTGVRFVSETYRLLCYTQTFSSHMQWQRWNMENTLLLSTEFRKVTQTILMTLSPKQSGGCFVFAVSFLSSLHFIIIPGRSRRDIALASSVRPHFLSVWNHILVPIGQIWFILGANDKYYKLSISYKFGQNRPLNTWVIALVLAQAIIRQNID